MLGLSQGNLADALDVTFQQVQKYEKGFNRIGASRLHQLTGILQVPVSFFFEGGPGQAKTNKEDLSLTYVSAFLATSDGLKLTKAFMQIKDLKLRRSIVAAVVEIAG